MPGNVSLFIFVALTTVYWHLWYKLGPSMVRDILKRTGGGKRQIEHKNSAIEGFLGKLNYKNFYVIDSPIAFGMAQPLSKSVLVSSKIWDSGNINLIKYVLAHETAHKKQGNTKFGVVFFFFWIVCFSLIYLKFEPPLLLVIFWAFIVGRLAMFAQRKFEDIADIEVARVLGKENTAQAIKDIFILNKTPLGKRNWWWDKLVINRDYPGRMKTIGYNDFSDPVVS